MVGFSEAPWSHFMEKLECQCMWACDEREREAQGMGTERWREELYNWENAINISFLYNVSYSIFIPYNWLLYFWFPIIIFSGLLVRRQVGR